MAIHSSSAEYLTYIAATGDASESFEIRYEDENIWLTQKILHYNFQMIIAVGFKVNNERAVRFRKWAVQIVKDYAIQGWTMDKEHMFTDEYFEQQLTSLRWFKIK